MVEVGKETNKNLCWEQNCLTIAVGVKEDVETRLQEGKACITYFQRLKIFRQTSFSLVSWKD